MDEIVDEDGIVVPELTEDDVQKLSERFHESEP